MDPDPLPWLIFGLSLLLVGLATALEIMFTVASRSDIRQKIEQGQSSARVLDELLNNSLVLFITLGLLKNASLLSVGVASTWLALQDLSPEVLVGIFCSWLLLALLQPTWRILAMRYADPLIFQFAPLVKGLQFLLRPLVSPIYHITAQVNQREQTRNEDGNGLTDEALRVLMHTTEGAEEIEENEREMIESILEMNETVAREVMVPRIDMVAIDVETSFQEALNTIISAGHSRIPVYEDHIDHIIGILYAKDILRCFRDQVIDVPIRELLRPPYFVPVSKKVDVLFQEMQKQRVHIATVIDEYGGTAGLVTIEDIIEEIMGDIQDEYDVEDTYVQVISPDVYLLNSRLDVYSLSKLLDIALDNDEADTLGGLLFSLMEHVPEQGESVEYEGWRFTVLALDGRRIEQVRIERVTVPTTEEPVPHPTTAKQNPPMPNADTLINIRAMGD